MSAAKLNIWQKINEVRKAVPYAQKDAKVQGYKGITHDYITALLRPELEKQGIIIVPNETSSSMEEINTTSKGNKMFLFQAKYEICFVNADQPDEVVKISLTSHANDTGDKAPGKAISYATKMAMLKLFSIETGENDESRVQRIDPITDLQIEQLNGLIAKSADKDATVRWILAQCQIEKLNDMSKTDFTKVHAAISKKVKGNGTTANH